MKNVLYVILNGSLTMSPGKAAAQAVHAAMRLNNKHRKAFVEDGQRSVIVLEAIDREQLDGIADYLVDNSFDFETYIDEGVNEVAPFSMTAMAIEPCESNAELRHILHSLPLYGKTKPVLKWYEKPASKLLTICCFALLIAYIVWVAVALL
jgi:peptidyl-tRNA hydrolase